MNMDRQFLSRTRRRAWVVLFAWFCCISSFSVAVPVQQCPTHCECSINRDGLQTATCTDAQWNKISYPNIHVLILKPSDSDIECNIPDDIHLLFPQLNFFNLKNCSLTYILSNSFQNLKSLQEVDLSHNHIRKFSQSLFTDNTKLKYVNLEQNPLKIGSNTLLLSNSICELNLAGCNISRLTSSSFKGLPNVRYLTLANNKLQTIKENTFPKGLKILNLSGNQIVNVPLDELNRLNGLKEIDLSRNPINCTCELMGFQNWVSGMATVFRNEIQCTLPPEFSGWSLIDVPQYQMCDAKVQQNEQIDWNPVVLNDGPAMDNGLHQDNDDGFIFNTNVDTIVGKRKNGLRSLRGGHLHFKKSKTIDKEEVEGSGDDDPGFDGSGDSDSTREIGTEEPPSSETVPLPQKSEESTKNKTIFDTASETVPPVENPPTTTQKFQETELKTEAPAHEPKESTSKNFQETEQKTVPPTQKSEESTTHKTFLETRSETVLPVENPLTTTKNSQESDQETVTLVQEPGESTSRNFQEPEPETVPPTQKSKESTTNNMFPETRSETVLPVENPPTTTKNFQETDRETVTLAQEPGEPTSTKLPEEKIHDITDPPITKYEEPKLSPKSDEVETTTKPVERIDVGEKNFTKSQDEASGSVLGELANSTEKPVQSHITNTQNANSFGGASYIIPTLLIIAVVLICLSVYFSQHSCRVKKAWSQTDPKMSNTELQDVNLLGPDEQNQNLDKYSTKYQAEGESVQTEKLMNGDGGCCEGEDYSNENKTTLSLTNDNVPADMKNRTQGVTNDYESLTKKPIIIRKS